MGARRTAAIVGRNPTTDGAPLYLTPVDAFDTMVLMGLTKEASEAKQIIFDSLSFNRNVEVRAFEIIIRELGGCFLPMNLMGTSGSSFWRRTLELGFFPFMNQRPGCLTGMLIL